DLLPRIITAVVGIPILIGIIWAAPPWVFMVFGALAVAIGAWEYVSITMGTERRIAQLVTCATTLGLYAAMALTNVPQTGPDGSLVLCALAAGVVAQFMVHLFTYRAIEEVTLHIGSGLVAVLYAGMLPGLLVLLHQDAGALGGIWVLLTMATVWGSDAGAYFVGRAFGKHKLAPRVSPKKSIEGAVGGLVTSVIAVFIFKYVGLLPEL
ncbi:MAG: phosphatidate cytidylyltransferase, partial [Myxococcota bacterium]